MINKRLYVVGASNVDINVRMQGELQNDTSLIGEIYLTAGGVGRNIVAGLAGLRVYVSFISAFSDDIFSSVLLEGLENEYISLEDSIFHAEQTSKYVSIVTSEEIYGINDVKSISKLSVSFIQKKLLDLDDAPYVIFDLNICEDIVDFITQNVRTRLICEATSTVKCKKISNALDKLYILKANFQEACIIAEQDQDIDYDELLDKLLSKGIEKVYITLGEKGALYADRTIKLYAGNQKTVDIKDAVGAGDIFTAGIMYGEIRHWPADRILHFCTRLCYGYLLSGKHKLNCDLEYYALDSYNKMAHLLTWDVNTAQWIAKEKYNGKKEEN